MAWRDREGWLNFVFLADGRGDETNHHEELGLKRISCATQLNIPDTAGTSSDPACNTTDTRTSQPNQARRTPDFPFPLVSTSCSSSSPISLFLVHNSTIIAEHIVMSSLSISPCRNHQLTLSTSIYQVQAYSEYKHTPKIVCCTFILMIGSWPLNVASASGVLPFTIDRQQPALHESSKVKSACYIPTVAS